MNHKFRILNLLVLFVLVLSFGCSHNELTKEEKLSKSFKEGCENNSGSDCSFLAHELFYQKKISEAKALYEKACKLGFESSCLDVDIIEYKEGKRKDLKEIFSKECELKKKGSCYKLGRLESMVGTFKNSIAAHEKGCELKNAEDCVTLGIINREKPELEEKYQRKACELGDLVQCDFLKIGKVLRMSKEQGEAYSRDACKNGDQFYCYYYEGNIAPDNKKDFSCSMCNEKNAFECMHCASLHKLSDDERGKALDYYSKACAYGNEDGCRSFKIISNSYIDKTERTKIFEQKCKEGDKKFCEYLESFK